jgi:O-antigen/teichoic acid export membrane protein
VNQTRLILKNTAVLGLSEVIERLSTVFLGICVARKLGAGAFGVYSVAMVYYSFLFLAAELGCTTYLVREIAKDRSQTSRLVVHAALISGVLAFIVAAGARVVLPFVNLSRDVELALLVVIWAIVPAILRAIQESVFVAYSRAEFLTYSALAAGVINLAATLLLLASGFGVISLVLAFTIVQFVVAVFYFFSINRYMTLLHWEFSPSFAFKMLRDIRPFTGTSLIQGFLSRPEIILLSFAGSNTQVGFYSAALKITDLWQVIPRSLMTSVFPVLVRYHHAGSDAARSLRERSIRYLFAVSFPIAVGLFIAARPVLHWLYGDGFEPSVGVLKILVWTIPLVSLWSVLWRVLSARGEHGATLHSQIVTLFFRALAGYVAIHFLASIGAAISAVASMLLLDLLLAHQVRRDGSHLSLARLSGKLALAAVAMGAVTMLLHDHLQLWVLAFVSAAAYAAMIFLFRAFPAEDLIMLRNLWNARST